MKLEADINGTSIPVDIDLEGGVFKTPSLEGRFQFEILSDGRSILRIEDRIYRLDGLKLKDSSLEFSLNGQFLSVRVSDEQALLLRKLGYKTNNEQVQGQLKAPMPGKIIAVQVQAGDTVTQGQALVVLEAMKMENELKAPVSGHVSVVSATVGSSVEKNQLLIEIEPIG
jgi:biotin carboxyl carrier protein